MQDSIDQDPPQPKPPSALRRFIATLASGLSGITWVAVLAAGVILAFGYLYPQDYQVENRLLKLLNCCAFGAQVLQFHIGVAAGVAMIVALLIGRKALWAVATIVLLAGVMPTALSWLPKDPPPAAGPTLRVHSVNILFANVRLEKAVAELERVDADVIALQEWSTWHEANLLPLLADRWPHMLTAPHSGTAGMAILSKRPLLETSSPDGSDLLTGETWVRMQRAVIEHEGRPVAIYNVHPKSPGNLRAAVSNQEQTIDMLKILDAEALPSIVIGDFNAHTATGNIELFRDSGFSEVHETAGKGPGWTWPRKQGNRWLHLVVRNLPGVRIDHCMLSPQLTATNAEVGRDHGSDHLGVIADLGWK